MPRPPSRFPSPPLPPSGHFIVLLWLTATAVHVLMVVAFAAETAMNYYKTRPIPLFFASNIPIMIVLGLWFGLATTGFWMVRQRRFRDATRRSLSIAWVWAFTWWLLPWATAQRDLLAFGVPEAPGLLASAVVMCFVIWRLTRWPGGVVMAGFGAASLLTLLAGPVLWPALVYGSLAWWASGSPPPDPALADAHAPLCPTCAYDQTGLPSGAKCPECGHIWQGELERSSPRLAPDHRPLH
jgi:hypothetical protein